METCKGTNCTSDGTTPHSADCMDEYAVASSGARYVYNGDVTMSHEVFVELHADAQRYRGIRLMLCEQDEAIQARMFEALEKYGDTVPELDAEPKAMTADRLDAIIDGAILAAAGARNEHNP